LTAVERANPGCVAETRQHRLPLYGNIVNHGAALIEANKLDSASALLKRARVIHRHSPYSYYYEAILAQRRNDNATARSSFRQALELATPQASATDSGIAAVREQSMFLVGLSAFNQATATQGAEQGTLMREAAAAFQAYLKAYPNGANAPAAQSGLARAIAQSGDSASAAELYKQMLTDPSKYTDEQLFESGGNAFQTGNKEEAAQLFALGLEKNAYYRPALFNLANTYFALKRWDDMLPVARKLVQVDPNNPDNWQLLAIAHEGLSKTAGSAKEKRAHMDSVRVHLETSNSLPARVAFTQFDRNGNTHTLAGTIENVAASSKDYTLKFEFLDRQGNVVATKEAQVSVPAKGKKEFRVQVAQDGVAAFRYARIS
jgi:tetratricopeptide (TPR) repeat protein